VSTPRWLSKVLPCQPKWLTITAISGLKTVPGAMMAVPLPWPSGMGPLVAWVEEIVELLLALLHELFGVHGPWCLRRNS